MAAQRLMRFVVRQNVQPRMLPPDVICRELHRLNWGLVANVIGNALIKGIPVCILVLRRTHEGARGIHVTRHAVVIEIAEHHDILLHRGQRSQDFGQLKFRLCAADNIPRMRIYPASLVQHTQPHRISLGRLRFSVADRRLHDLQERQRQRYARPLQKGPARNLICVSVHDARGRSRLFFAH